MATHEQIVKACQLIAQGMEDGILNAPIIDIVVRKKGEWIVYKAPDEQHCGLVKRPFCGENMIAEADEYNFCPGCGSDMRSTT